MPSSSTPVTVLGAGVAGLTAAWHLAGQGVPVRVVERDSHVGGMAVTLERDGYRFDLGPHRFHTEDRTILGLIRALLGDELLHCQRSSRIHLNGRYLDYPPSVPSLVRSVPPGTSVRCLYDYARNAWPLRNGHIEEADFETWMVNRFGQHLYDLYFGPYTCKVWGTDPSLLSVELARRRITVPSLPDVLLRLMISSKQEPGPYVTEFLYPKDGIGRIGERLAEEVVSCRGEIHLEHEVKKVHVDGGRIVGLTVQHGGQSHIIACDRVISTLPLPSLIRCLDPRPGDRVVAAAAALSFRALLYVFLMVDGPPLTREHWLYFPESHVPFNRVTEPRNFSVGHAPVGKTSLCAEVTCDVDDAVWRLSPEALIKQTIEHLARVGLLDPARVEGAFTQRTRWGYPLYAVGYERHLKRLVEHIVGIEDLVSCGRQGGFDYSNMARAMASGLDTARKLGP